METSEHVVEFTGKVYECPDCAFTFDAVHVTGLGVHECPVCELERTRAVIEAARSLSQQVEHVLREHGDDYEVMHEGMRQSAEMLDETLRILDCDFEHPHPEHPCGKRVQA